MYSKLTEMDKNKIVDYINAYSGTKISSNLKDILRVWDENKSVYLSNIFKDKLILSKTITYEKPNSEIHAELSKDLIIRSFVDNLYNFVNNDFWKSYNEKYYFLDLLHLNHLVRNRVPGYCPVLVLNLPNNKTFKIQPGMKILKFYEKLCEKYEIPRERFEAFRIEHSKILNTAKLKGELCLSIHPLDYMTMSDNDCDWRSCMSWKHKGGYRRGTVGMMNSESAIVVYLKSSTDMNLVGDHTWNNKKWRSLFVVTEDFITSVKGYPYSSNSLTEIALDWLVELSGGKWSKLIDHEGSVFQNIKDINPKIDFDIYLEDDYDSMYNDFGSDVSFVRFNIDKINETPTKNNYHINHNYSGPEVCMSCGTMISKESFDCDDNTHFLCCEECLELYYCRDCGQLYSREEMIENNGDYFCESCAHGSLKKDLISGEYHYCLDMKKIYVKDTNQFIDYFYVDRSSIGSEKWFEYFVSKPREEIIHSYWYDEKKLVVNESDFTQFGKEEFMRYQPEY